MNQETPQGTRLGDYLPRPPWLGIQLKDKDLAVGDLVTYTLTSHTNGMTLYRIVKDCPPNPDLVWESVEKKRFHQWQWKTRETYAWVKPGTKTPIPVVRLKGCIEIAPVLQLFPGPKASKRTVCYDAIYRVRKVDIVSLGRSFASFQDFIDQEVKRLKSE